MKEIQEIAGDYFLGDGLGEFAGWYATKAKGFYKRGLSENPVQGLKNCSEAKDTYIRQIGKEIKIRRDNGANIVSSTEAVAFTHLDYEAGVDVAVIEVPLTNMEIMLSFARGAQRAYNKEILGAWLAHEFYGGFHQFDPLKAKRFTMEYYTLYLAGVDYVGLESGAREIHSHVDQMLPETHPLTQSYLNEAEKFAKFCNTDIRPGKEGPITKIAFVQGNLDGYGCGHSSSLWGQYYDEKWGFSDSEYAYRILDEVYRGIECCNNVNFGDYDYSHAPAYGQYDVIPATISLQALLRYEWVIFCGWNTMTPEIAQTFKKYVELGGNLIISAAQIRDGVDRDNRGNFAKYDWENFLGVRLTDEIIRTNDGFKFVKYSTVDGIIYPGTNALMCDPSWSAGYTDYVKIKPVSAKPVCYLADSFGRVKNSVGELTGDQFNITPIITENKVGNGNVIFMANSFYPGNPAVFPLYKIIVKAVLAASHRTCDLKVIGNDKLRFAAFEDDKLLKVYVLNSDFNSKNFVKVIYKEEETERIVDSVGLEIFEFKKK